MHALYNKFHSVKESLAVSRIASTYAWSSIVKFPEGERFQVSMNTYVKCVSMPKNPIGNILIIQGGVRHMNSNSYYIRTACSFLSKYLRVFIFEMLKPVNNYEFGHEVANCLTLIKREFPGYTAIIGYSMGGILLYSYLSMGYDQADLYIPTCCPLDMEHFRETISIHPLFRYIQNKACQCYQVDGYEDLLEISGTSTEKHKEFEKTFIENLNRHADKWLPKTIYILSSDDPLTNIEDLELFKKPPLTYFIQNGWHCCLESILLSTTLANRFIKAKSEGAEVELDKLPSKLGAFDIIKTFYRV